MILASDGLWDVVQNEEAIEFVREGLGSGHTLLKVSQLLVDYALDNGSDDNVTVTIVLFEANALPINQF